MEKTHKIRAWNSDLEKYFYVDMTLNQIIEKPNKLNGLDMAVVLINHFRRERGIELLPKQELYYKVLKRKNYEN